MKFIRYSLLGFVLCIGIIFILVNIKSPSNDRSWLPEVSRLVTSEIDNDEVVVKNVRNSRYDSSGNPAVLEYETRKYNFDNIKTLDFFVVPFGSRETAHTLLSFGFQDDYSEWSYLTLSVEARKEIDEDYSILKGLLNEYEIIYVWADERDVLPLRTDFRKNEIWRYQISIEQESLQNLFVGMLNRTNQLAVHPEFYNTIFNNCTSSLFDDVNSILGINLPYTSALFKTERSGDYLVQQGLVFDDQVKKKVPANVDNASRDYSTIIRN